MKREQAEGAELIREKEQQNSQKSIKLSRYKKKNKENEQKLL